MIVNNCIKIKDCEKYNQDKGNPYHWQSPCEHCDEIQMRDEPDHLRKDK